jgi:hypothetical protein
MIKALVSFFTKSSKNNSSILQNDNNEIAFPIHCDKFVRRVTKSKWENQVHKLNNTVSADAITSCLKTKGNKMSVWSVENLEDAVLALASTNTSIAIVDVVELDAKRLKQLNFSVYQKDAETPAEQLNNKHYDIVDLDYTTLGVIANEIASETTKDSAYIKRYSASAVKKILKNAITDGKIKIDALDKNLRNNLS